MSQAGDESGKETPQQARWLAADIITWGGLPGDGQAPAQDASRQLPDHWVDVTDTVLEALAQVRAAETKPDGS